MPQGPLFALGLGLTMKLELCATYALELWGTSAYSLPLNHMRVESSFYRSSGGAKMVCSGAGSFRDIGVAEIGYPNRLILISEQMEVHRGHLGGRQHQCQCESQCPACQDSFWHEGDAVLSVLWLVCWSQQMRLTF